jgi:DNA-binding transcriptional MerR regulator
MNGLTIGQLGQATATKVETIRYYEKIGLLPAPVRTAGNYRSYADRHVQLLGFIRRSRELGFSIEEVRELLELARHHDAPCVDVDELVARHLETTERKIEALRRLRRELRDTLMSCRGGRVAECRVIQALSSDPSPRKRKSGHRSDA